MHIFSFCNISSYLSDRHCMRGYNQRRLTHHLLIGSGRLRVIQAPLINMTGDRPMKCIILQITIFKYMCEYLSMQRLMCLLYAIDS